MSAVVERPNGNGGISNWLLEHPEISGEASYEQEGTDMAVTRLHEEDKRDIARYVSEAGGSSNGKKPLNVPAIVFGCIACVAPFGGFLFSSANWAGGKAVEIEHLKAEREQDQKNFEKLDTDLHRQIELLKEYNRDLEIKLAAKHIIAVGPSR